MASPNTKGNFFLFWGWCGVGDWVHFDMLQSSYPRVCTRQSFEAPTKKKVAKSNPVAMRMSSDTGKLLGSAMYSSTA